MGFGSKSHLGCKPEWHAGDFQGNNSYCATRDDSRPWSPISRYGRGTRALDTKECSAVRIVLSYSEVNVILSRNRFIYAGQWTPAWTQYVALRPLSGRDRGTAEMALCCPSWGVLLVQGILVLRHALQTSPGHQSDWSSPQTSPAVQERGRSRARTTSSHAVCVRPHPTSFRSRCAWGQLYATAGAAVSGQAGIVMRTSSSDSRSMGDAKCRR